MASICLFEAILFPPRGPDPRTVAPKCYAIKGSAEKSKNLLQKGPAFSLNWSGTDSTGRGDRVGISPRDGGTSR
jgi:hypothetical protein